MSINTDTLNEIELLNLFDLNSAQQGLKIHHEAKKNLIDAALRLYDKGMITQADGGYLTDRGLEAAEHAQVLFRLLKL